MNQADEEKNATLPNSSRTNYSCVLVGNPNVGKSTLFNKLTGQNQHVANYPGVTVAKKYGQFSYRDHAWTVIDLPGTYSLVARSPDEKIATDVLLGEVQGVQVDAVVCVVDASNLRRGLYLVSQTLELGLPTVVAITKLDLLRDRGTLLEIPRLASALNVPVVPLALLQSGSPLELQQTLHSLVSEASGKVSESRHRPLPACVYQTIESVVGDLSRDELKSVLFRDRPSLAPIRLLRRALSSDETSRNHSSQSTSESLTDTVKKIRQAWATSGIDWRNVESEARYRWIDKHLESFWQSSPNVGDESSDGGQTLSDWLDPYLTHGFGGLVVFLALMFAMFYAVFAIADPAASGVDWVRGAIGDWISQVLPDGMFRDMLTEGVIGGVGNFVVFLPQIFVLFLFIGVMESTGYMARAAYLMDRVFSPVGLSGKSFVPLLSSFACAVPGVMATRIIERPRDRLLTIMIAPLMSCSARLPVYILMTQALISEDSWFQALVLMSMYMIGLVVALLIVVIWKRLVWREKSPEFVLELPEYQFPQLATVVRRTWERTREFIVRAGTIILAVTLLVWAANYFPRNDALVQTSLSEIAALEATLGDALEQEPAELSAEQQTQVQQLNRMQLAVAAKRQEYSYLGQAGKWIEPVVKPLGWDWRIGCAVLASFPAREVIVTTLGILYQVQDPDEESSDLHLALRQATWADTDRPVFTIPVALSIMVFFALCSQCASTLAVIYQETKSWWWPALSFAYMTGLAYIAAWAIFRLSSLWIG